MTNLISFEQDKIRKIWHHEQWYFSVIDIIAVLTEQLDFKKAKSYWTTLKSRLKNEGSELVTKCDQLKLQSADGKFYKTDVANIETLLRLIQSVPSPKAEPLKLWLEKSILEEFCSAETPVKIISIDEIKKAFPDYDPKNADEFHSESAKIANKLFDEEIKKIKGQKIVLMCGGSASGKTEFIDKFFIPDFEGIIFDSTLSTEEGAKIKIKTILDSGNIPVLSFIIPKDLKKAFDAFHNRERIVPEHRFFETHSGSRKTSLWVAENYSNIEIFVYENGYTPKISEEDELSFVMKEFNDRSELIDFLRSIQYNIEQIQSLIF